MSKRVRYAVDVVHANGCVNCQPGMYRSKKEAADYMYKVFGQITNGVIIFRKLSDGSYNNVRQTNIKTDY